MWRGDALWQGTRLRRAIRRVPGVELDCRGCHFREWGPVDSEGWADLAIGEVGVCPLQAQAAVQA
jgi:hypothetical protein